MEHHLHDGNGKVGRTQALFREVNERIVELVLGASGSDERLEIVCECASEDCTEPIAISAEEYDAVRGISTRFVVRPGHVVPEAERVVASPHGYTVVDKFGDAGTAAVQLDPRRRKLGAPVAAG